MYADPTRRLYDELGMVSTLALGPPPKYMAHTSIWASSMRSIVDVFKHMPRGLALKSGDKRQVGGEFLFENPGNGADVSVSWCHRMKNTRDHTETDDMQKLLGLDKFAADVGAKEVTAASTKAA